jgi:nicotinic acid mononucleotide adenylyltransferase
LVLGLGCTASLATDRPKRGEHRAHITVQSDEAAINYSLIFHKGARDREAEEAVVDSVLLNALAEAVGSAERLPAALLPDETVHVESVLIGPLTAGSLFRGELTVVCAQVDGRLTPDAPRPVALLPGAFNPVHEGHWRLAEIAAQWVGAPVDFELSVLNVDKPPLLIPEMRQRLLQFSWRAPVWITRAATFSHKAGLFPGVVFVIGADTAQRLVDLRYYGDSESGMLVALDQVRARGCRFLVAGRENHEGKFVAFEHLDLPTAHRDLFTGIPASAFCMPISSTALRDAAQNADCTKEG